MPKNKKEKNSRICRYSEESVQKALDEIKAGSSKKATAAKYGIPRATLQFRLSEKFKKTEKGPSPILTKKEEQSLVDWILDSYKKGFPRRREDIQASVKTFLDAVERKTPFKNNIPGKHWYEAFLRRHPILVHRTSEAVTSASANVSEADIRKWFEQIENYLRRKGYFPILEDPTRVFNGDETCFLFCPKIGRVIAPLGAKNVYEVDQGDAKQNLTVMFTFSASGAVTPPLIIYPNKRLSATIQKSIPDHWGIGSSDNGWMKAEIFVDYIKHIFHPYLIENKIELPIILFLDGHKTHLTYEVCMLCNELNIILIALYPNSTRILQPADVSSFKPLKNGWKKSVLEWRRQNPYIKLGKEHFAPILDRTLSELKSETVVKGFEACGLYPWNPDRIDFTKCLGKSAKSTVENENSTSENSMTMKDFSVIVGENKLAELKNDSSLHKCESNDILGKIYRYFKNNCTLPPNSTPDNDDSLIEITTNDDESLDIIANDNHSIIEITNNTISDPIREEMFSEEAIENMPMIFHGEPSCVDIESSQALPYNDKIIIHRQIKILKPKTIHVTEETQVPGSTNNTATSSELRHLDPIPECNMNELYTEMDFYNGTVMQKSLNLEGFLPKARTPQRKNKIQVKRSSFVITSSDYKKEMEEKKMMKEALERKKEENKRKRLEKQAQSDQLKKKKINKCTLEKNNEGDQNQPKQSETEINDKETPEEKNNIIRNSGLCFSCVANITSKKKGIKCQDCNRVYHIFCLKKKKILKDNYRCGVCRVKREMQS